MVDFRELVRLGAHFGHIKRRLHPRMNRYIWGCKNNVHLFDVSKTAQLIERAAKFLESVAAEKRTILWVGTKKPAQAAIFEVADKLKMPYVNHRWIGGTLSNFSQVKKSVTKLLHFEDILEKSEKFPHYTKKEFNTFSKMVDRLKKNIGGIRDLTWPIGAIVLVDVMKEGSALREAATVGIPVVAFVDTNSNPSLVDHVIPINDDSARVIKFVVDHLGEAVARGQKSAKEHAKKKKEEAELAKKAKIKAEGDSSTGLGQEKKKPVKKVSVKKVEKKPVEKKVEKKPAAKKTSVQAAVAKKKPVAAEKKETVKKAVAPKKEEAVSAKASTAKPAAKKKEEEKPVKKETSKK